MSKKLFHDITIGELLQIKKINKMTLRNAMPEMVKLKKKYNLSDIETKNLIIIARDFSYKMAIKAT